MSRTLLLATALVLTSSAASADHDRVKWDGVIHLVSQSAQCQGQFREDENNRSRYHPRLESGDPPSSLTRSRGGEGNVELITIAGNGQLNGTGQYSARNIGGGEFFTQPNGTYNFTQTPATVLPTTDFVSLSGSLHKYAGIAGCTLTFRATYVRVDPEIHD
jgi:hypothetical protein